jgi:hypothetical protein
MDGRSDKVLHLHNTMSTVLMAATIGGRASNKEEFREQWNDAPVTVVDDANALYNMVKKHLGGGDVDMPVSSLGLPGMHAFMVTGWDWQRKAITKNVAREALPSIQGIFLEMQFAKTYRPTLLEDPIVWELRNELNEIMTAHQPRSKLKVATAGPLAIRKEWSYWDGIKVAQPSENVALTMDEETQQQMLRDNRRLAAEKADCDAIMKIIKQVAVMPIARLNSQKNSGIAIEVADALNELSQVSERQNLRIERRLSMRMSILYERCELTQSIGPVVELSTSPSTQSEWGSTYGI